MREKEFEPAGLGLGGPETLATLFAQPLIVTLLTFTPRGASPCLFLGCLGPLSLWGGKGGGESEETACERSREPDPLRDSPGESLGL